MIVQHPLLWCAMFLAAGTLLGLVYPLPYYLLLLCATLAGCVLLQRHDRWHDMLLLAAWLFIGCSRAALCTDSGKDPVWIDSIREDVRPTQRLLMERLMQAEVSPKTLALSSALVLGNRETLTSDIKNSYSQAGVSHLLALSGMHLGILYALFYLVFIFPLRHSRWRWTALLPLTVCIWGYTVLTGLPVSLVRAALMLTFFSIMQLWHYRTDPLHPWALSAIIILLVSPRQLAEISFQLSFVAVFFLIAVWSFLSEKYPKTRWVVKMLASSAIAQIGTMPLVIYYFHRISLLAPFLSIILIPLTSAIIYLTLLTLCMPCAVLGWALDTLAGMQERLIGWANQVHWATSTGIYPSLLYICLLYAMFLLLTVLLRTSRDFRD